MGGRFINAYGGGQRLFFRPFRGLGSRCFCQRGLRRGAPLRVEKPDEVAVELAQIGIGHDVHERVAPDDVGLGLLCRTCGSCTSLDLLRHGKLDCLVCRRICNWRGLGYAFGAQCGSGREGERDYRLLGRDEVDEGGRDGGDVRGARFGFCFCAGCLRRKRDGGCFRLRRDRRGRVVARYFFEQVELHEIIRDAHGLRAGGVLRGRRNILRRDGLRADVVGLLGSAECLRGPLGAHGGNALRAQVELAAGELVARGVLGRGAGGAEGADFRPVLGKVDVLQVFHALVVAEGEAHARVVAYLMQAEEDGVVANLRSGQLALEVELRPALVRLAQRHGAVAHVDAHRHELGPDGAPFERVGEFTVRGAGQHAQRFHAVRIFHAVPRGIHPVALGSFEARVEARQLHLPPVQLHEILAARVERVERALLRGCEGGGLPCLLRAGGKEGSGGHWNG